MLRPSGDRQPPATRGEGRRVSPKESRDSEPSDIKRLNFALTHGELARPSRHPTVSRSGAATILPRREQGSVLTPRGLTVRTEFAGAGTSFAALKAFEAP